MGLIERYCIGTKPLWEHDNQCYYHGACQVCPICGKVTKSCQDGTYTPEPGYTLREIGG